MSVLLLILGLLLFIGLIVAHEWGHFIMARRNGVEVEEFGIFFPPRLFKHKTKGGWNFTFNLIPLGGFVKLKGEHDTDTAKGSFGAAGLWAKSKIMAAGVTVNLLIALILLTVLAVIGLPSLVPNQYTVKSDTKTVKQALLLTSVEKGSPAAKAGLEAEDRILAIGPVGKPAVAVTGVEQLHDQTQKLAGQKVAIQYSRHGDATQVATTTLLGTGEVTASQKAYDKQVATAKACQDLTLPKGYLGVSTTEFTTRRSTWSAPVTAVGFGAQATALTFKGLGSAVAGLGSTIAGAATGNTTARQNGQCAASSQVSGPVGIFFVLKDGSILGYQFMLLIIAIISLTLGIMNLLPIPGLDGGRLWLTLITRGLFKKPLTAQLEERINASGVGMLLILIALITIVDIKRFF